MKYKELFKLSQILVQTLVLNKNKQKNNYSLKKQRNLPMSRIILGINAFSIQFHMINEEVQMMPFALSTDLKPTLVFLCNSLV